MAFEGEISPGIFMNFPLLKWFWKEWGRGFLDFVLSMVCKHEGVSNIIYKPDYAPIKNSAPLIRHGCLRFFNILMIFEYSFVTFLMNLLTIFFNFFVFSFFILDNSLIFWQYFNFWTFRFDYLLIFRIFSSILLLFLFILFFNINKLYTAIWL